MTASELALLPEKAANEFRHWRRILEPLLHCERGIAAALAAAAKATGEAEGTIRKKLYAVRKGGWPAIVDRRLLGPAAWATKRREIGLSEADKSLVRTYAERYQRDSSDDAAIDALRRDWRRGVVASSAELDPRTGYPRGWSKRNLRRALPTEFELKNARIGRASAFSERRLVYTTRAHLWVGSHYLFDDIWHDNFANQLDLRKSGRPLEFHGLDLYSACKFAWGVRLRTEQEGVNRGLTGADFRFLIAQVLGTTGYDATRGTTLVLEHGTAALATEIDQLLYDETHGMLRVCRSGMEGASAAAHQYAGRAKGNFRLKAALESLGNLIHNELAYLPAQTGKDRDHRPEQLHGLLKANDALLIALGMLSPERAEMLRWPMLTIQQFRLVLEEVYARINARTEHDLEGWDAHYVPDERTGFGMRRLSPAEVHRRGRTGLTCIAPAACAAIVARDIEGVERTVRRGMIELTASELTGDTLRFDAARAQLRDGDKVLGVLNPFLPDRLTIYNAKGAYVADLPRIFSVDRADTDAVMREIGAARKAEAEALQPFRQRHAAQARRMAADARHNARVLRGEPSRLPSAAELEAANSSDSPPPRAHQGDDADALAARLSDFMP